MKTLVYGNHIKSQISSAKALENEGIIKIVVLIMKDKGADVNMGDFRRLNFRKNSYKGYNKDIYDDVFKEAVPTFLDMFSRIPLAHNLSYQEFIQIFNYYFDYLSALLIENQIELLLFFTLPHFGSDYLLVVLAKYLRLKMVLMSQSLVPNRFFYVTSLEDFGTFHTAKTIFDAPYITIPCKVKKTYFYMKNIPIANKNCHYLLANDLKKYILKKRSRKTFWRCMKSYIECVTFKKNYKKYKKSQVDLNKKYVYFPLHLQPELTTSTLGGRYSDQLLALEMISDIIPDDWLIYVKENPKQLGLCRGSYFFMRLGKIEKAVYIAKNFDTFALTQNAKFVATVTGSVGWEAISGGKSAVVFGQAWYSSLPGVIKYNHRLNIEDVLSCKFSHDELEQAYNELIKKTAIGIVDRDYEIVCNGYNDADNIQNLKESLKKIIENFH